MKFENTDVWGFEHAIRGARNPMNSWDRSDSGWIDYHNDYYKIGENDLRLLQKLIKAGSEHRKFMRQIFVSVDITAPLYWWKEMDTYKIGTTANSTSFMHKGISKPFNIKQFEIDIPIKNIEKYKDVPCNIKLGDEIWKKIKDFDNYEVSNTGKVRINTYQTIDSNGAIRTYEGHELNQAINSSNYKKVSLRKDGKNYNKYVHRLIAEAFIPNPNNYQEINHIDGNKHNNNIDNLEWVTKSKNAIHAFNNELRDISMYNRRLVSQSESLFNIVDIITIQRLYELGITKNKIAKIYNTYNSNICNLLNDKKKITKDIELNYAYEDCIKIIIDELNELRDEYIIEQDIERKKMIWRKIVQLLPESWLQTRTITMNYENVLTICRQRQGHKLTEWKQFIDWAHTLPYAEELIFVEDNNGTESKEA